MRQNIKKSLLLMMLALAVVNCGGPRNRMAASSASGTTSFIGQRTGTGGVNPQANPYATLSPAAEVSQMKQTVGVTEQNQQFASGIQEAKLTSSPKSDTDNSPLEMQVTLDGSSQPLLFRGDLQAQDQNGFVSELTETTGQRPDLKIAAQCKDKECTHGDLVLSDENGHKAGIIVNKEYRDAELKLPDDETEAQIKNTNLEAYQKARKVEVTSTEIIPGKSSYSIREVSEDPKAPTLALNGALFQPEGNEIPTTGNDVANKLGNISLVGKDNDSNELIFKVEEPAPANQAKQKDKSSVQTTVAYWRILPSEGTTVAPVVKQNCPVQPQGSVHPWINAILKDCTHPKITEHISAWTKSKLSRQKLNNFLYLYSQSFQANKPSQAMDFRKMLVTLHKNNMPLVWSLVTLRESNFDWTHPGGSGEVGVWQILPATARGLGLSSPALLKEIVPSTETAVKYYKSFIRDWGNDPEMLIASYNAGNKAQKIARAHIYDPSFWVLCQTNMLPDSTCEYTKDILSAMIVSLDPAAFGMSHIGGMEAL